jgi:hypothetical protein
MFFLRSFYPNHAGIVLLVLYSIPRYNSDPMYVIICSFLLLTLNWIYVILLYLIGFLSLHFGPMLFVCILHLQYDCVPLESLIVVYAPMYVILCSWNGILPQSECNACNSRYMASFSVFCSLFIVMLFYVGILHLQFDCVPLESLCVVYVPRYVILSSWNGILPLQSKF